MKPEQPEQTKSGAARRPLSSEYADKPIYNVPYIPVLFDMAFPPHITGKLMHIKKYPFPWMIDILDVDYERFRRLGGGKSVKWSLFQEIQRMLATPDVQERIINLYQSVFITHVYPELTEEENASMTLCEKIELAVHQCISNLGWMAEYREEVKDIFIKLQTLLNPSYTRKEMADILGVSRERIRQLLNTFPDRMLKGTLPGVSNYTFCPLLLKELDTVIAALPPVCSSRMLCGLFQCADLDSTVLKTLLPLQRVPLRRVPVGVSDYRNFDQVYYIPEDKDSKWLKTYINSLCGVLGNHPEIFEIRPVNIDGVMALLAQVEPAFTFDPEVVRIILSEHQWFETVTVDGEIRYRMKYPYLVSAYKSLARIVSEEKVVYLKDIDDMHRDRSGNPQAPSILNSVSVAKKHFPWIISTGQNGKIEYDEKGENRPPMLEVVRTWTKQRKLFTLEEIVTHLVRLGYTDIPVPTLRTYLSAFCYSDNKNSTLFCHADHVGEYEEGYSWRRKQRSGLINWIARKIHSYLLQTPSHILSLQDIHSRLQSESDELPNAHKLNTATHICIQKHLLKNGWVQYDSKVVKLTPRGCSAQPDELVNIGTRTRKPDYYDEVIAKVLAMLKTSPDGEIPMADVITECREIVGNRAHTVFYKIVEGYMTTSVTTFRRGNRVYIRLLSE